MLSASQFLKLEAESDLHLPLAVEGATGLGKRSKERVKSQSVVRVQVVHPRVDPGELGAIEEIERLAQYLHVESFLDVELPGEPQINVFHAWRSKSVAFQQRKPVGTARRSVEIAGRPAAQVAGDEAVVRKASVILED